MKTEIKELVREIKALCVLNKFKEAGILSRYGREKFIEFIVNGGNNELLYAYKVCSLFGMRQTDCFNLKF